MRTIPSSPSSSVLFLVDALGRGGSYKSLLTVLDRLHLPGVRLDLGVSHPGDILDDENFTTAGNVIYPGQRHRTKIGKHRSKPLPLRIIDRLAAYRSILKTSSPKLVVTNFNEISRIFVAVDYFTEAQYQWLAIERDNMWDRGVDISRRDVLRWTQKEATLAALRSADRILAVSEGLRDSLVRMFNLNPERTHHIPNPIDYSRIRERSADEVRDDKGRRCTATDIVAAGRFVPKKGFDDLIKAFAFLRQDVPATMALLGSGPMEKKLKDLIRKYEVEQYVQLPGYVDNPWAWMRRAKVVAVPSVWEGFCRIIPEAMACGAAVVSTRANYGPDEIISDESDGLLVEVGAVQELAVSIKRLLLNDSKREQLVRNAFQSVHRFSPDTIAGRYEKLLTTMLSES